ncbi:MAG: flippase, partial [Actinomycetota bacterium]
GRTPSNEPEGRTSSATSDDDRLEAVGRSSIGRNVVHLLSSQVVTWVLATLLAIVQPRFLGPEAQGQIRLAFSLWTVAQVFVGLGTSAFLTLEIARNRQSGIRYVGPVILARLTVFAVASLLLGATVIIADADQAFIELMILWGLVVALAECSDAIAAVFIGLERMAVPAMASIISRVFGTGVAIAVLLSGGSAQQVVMVGVAANALGLLIMIRAVRKIGTIAFAHARERAGFAIRASVGFLIAAAILAVYQQIDTIVISLLVDAEVLGWYSTADTLFGTLLFVPTIVMASIFPVLGRLFVDDPDEMERLVRRTLRLLIVTAVPIGLGTTLVANNIAPILYGDEFAETGGVLAVLGPVIILTFATVLFGTIALATGRQRLWNVVMATGVVMSIPLDVVLVPWADRTYQNGAIGGALAYVVTETFMVIIGLWKVAPFVLDRPTLSYALRTAAAGATMFAVTWPIRDQMVLIPILVGSATFILAALVFRAIGAEELRFVKENLAGRTPENST